MTEKTSNDPSTTSAPNAKQGLSTADLAASGQTGTQTQNPPQNHPGSTRVESRPVGAQASSGQTSEQPTPLFTPQETDKFRSEWNDIQTGFVDNPRQAVEQADNLVAQVMKLLAEHFADERNKLEDQWEHGQNISTEDLRVALQRYRSFFDRLLSV